MENKSKRDPRLARAGVSGFNKPKRTPNHPKKSHVVVAKVGDKVKTIRFGEQGAETAGKPKAGESDRMKKKRASFKARHSKNIAKGKMSAAYLVGKCHHHDPSESGHQLGCRCDRRVPWLFLHEPGHEAEALLAVLPR